MLGISETTFKDGGRGLRSVAASPRTYPVVIRLSTTPGDILDDTASTPRAPALKIVGVEGPAW
jgi:hypothetical protein